MVLRNFLSFGMLDLGNRKKRCVVLLFCVEEETTTEAGFWWPRDGKRFG